MQVCKPSIRSHTFQNILFGEDPMETEKEQETTTTTSTRDETQKITKPKIAMLSVAAAVLIFLMAFSCYGCSYQVPAPLEPEEAKMSMDKLYNTQWELDTEEGTPSLSEMHDLVIDSIEFGLKTSDSEFIAADIFFTGKPMLSTLLGYREGYGFYFKNGTMEFPIKVAYSQSKDEQTETLTLIGNESNTHCYYLKK